MKNIKRILLIILFFNLSFVGVTAFADESFNPDAWSEGLHLFAGIGLNSSLYTSDVERIDAGLGSNLKADLGCYFNDRWAFEWSTSVKFNRVNEYLIWDTLLTIGARYRFQTDLLNGSSYGRIFLGRSPTVIYFNGDAPEEYRDKGVSRVQFDGPAYGLAWGVMQKVKNKQTWFVEFAASVQTLEQHDGIQMDGEVPVVIMSGPQGDKSQIWSVYASFGILVF